jgi:hypothetical protein
MSKLWREEDERYLQTIKKSCVELSKDYHIVYFNLKVTQARFKIPAIIIGSFTGVASFGTSTFPESYHKWISVVVGLINVIIALLNTLESFLKIGEELSASHSASKQFRKLAEDIDRELSVDLATKQTSSITLLRDAYTRYQQIIGHSPVLLKHTTYLDDIDKQRALQSKQSQLVRKVVKLFSLKNKTAKNSIISEQGSDNNNELQETSSRKKERYSIDNIHYHLKTTDTKENITVSNDNINNRPNLPLKNIHEIQNTDISNIYIDINNDDNNNDTEENTLHNTRIERLKKLKQLLKK